MENDPVLDRLKEIHVNGLSFSSPEVTDILLPSQEYPYWQITLMDGSVIYASGAVTAICAPK